MIRARTVLLSLALALATASVYAWRFRGVEYHDNEAEGLCCSAFPVSTPLPKQSRMAPALDGTNLILSVQWQEGTDVAGNWVGGLVTNTFARVVCAADVSLLANYGETFAEITFVTPLYRWNSAQAFFLTVTEYPTNNP